MPSGRSARRCGCTMPSSVARATQSRRSAHSSPGTSKSRRTRLPRSSPSRPRTWPKRWRRSPAAGKPIDRARSPPRSSRRPFMLAPPSLTREVRKYADRATLETLAGRPVIRGHAIVFNAPSLVIRGWAGGFQEIIRPHAIQRTLKEKIDLRAFYDHDPGRVLGRLSSGTLRTSVDQRGLKIEIDPHPDIREHADLMRLIERGDVTGMSFAFETDRDWQEWDTKTDPPTRYVNDMRVLEVSVVSMPAYEQTDVEVGMRSM